MGPRPAGAFERGTTMHVRIRRAAVVLAVAAALAAGTLTSTAAPASAAASWPTTVLAAPLKSLARPQGLASAGGRLFATDFLAGRVRVYSEAGSLITSITGITAPDALASSADGTRLYVSGYIGSSSTISEISTATLKITATWTVAPCVEDLTVAPSAVYYSYGCIGDITGGLNHVDLTTREAHDVASPDVPDVSTSSADLAYADGTLWLLEWGGALRAWTVDGVALIDGRSAATGVVGGSSMSAHGSRLAMRGPNGVARIVSATDLSVVRTFSVPGTSIVSMAFSPDGATLVAAVYGPHGFMAWDAGSGSALFTTGIPGGLPDPVEPYGQDVVWNAAGTAVLTLSQYAGSNTEHSLIATGLTAPAAQTLSLTVKAPATYGAYSTFYLKGRPGAPVRLAVSSNGTTTVTTLTLSGTGRAIITRKLLMNYRVSAATPATLEYTPASGVPKSVVVPSRLTVVSSAGYKTVNGVTYYHRIGDAKHRIRLEPAASRSINATAWKWSGGRWVKLASQAFGTSTSGTLILTFVSAAPGTRYRLTYSFAGDARNGKSSAVGKPFVIA